MFQLSGINPTVCSGDQGLNKLAMATKKAIEQLAKGVGTVLRFKLTSTLTPGGSGTAEIQEFDGGGYSRQRDGVIHDEEPGGLWEGFVGDEQVDLSQPPALSDGERVTLLSPIAGGAV